jgi:hypothetical protein
VRHIVLFQLYEIDTTRVLLLQKSQVHYGVSDRMLIQKQFLIANMYTSLYTMTIGKINIYLLCLHVTESVSFSLIYDEMVFKFWDNNNND